MRLTDWPLCGSSVLCVCDWPPSGSNDQLVLFPLAVDVFCPIFLPQTILGGKGDPAIVLLRFSRWCWKADNIQSGTLALINYIFPCDQKCAEKWGKVFQLKIVDKVTEFTTIWNCQKISFNRASRSKNWDRKFIFNNYRHSRGANETSPRLTILFVWEIPFHNRKKHSENDSIFLSQLHQKKHQIIRAKGND